MIFIALNMVFFILFAAVLLLFRTKEISRESKKNNSPKNAMQFSKYMENLDEREIGDILLHKDDVKDDAIITRSVNSSKKNAVVVGVSMLFYFISYIAVAK